MIYELTIKTNNCFDCQKFFEKTVKSPNAPIPIRCDDCKKERKKYIRNQWGKNNQDKIKEYRQLSQSRPEYKEKQKQYKDKYYKENLELCRQKSRESKQRNPEVVRRHIQKRKAIKRGASSVENIDRMLVWKRDHGICYICKIPANKNNWHMDHKIPLIKGGSHTYDNVGVSPSCNLRKGVKING